MARIRTISLLFLCLLITCWRVHSQTPEDDEVDIGIPEYTHRFFSGYFDIGATGDNSIHYVFFHSQNDTSRDPLVLWLSGGPGCSSLLACFQENGPFIFKPEETKFTMNPNSWNNNANLLYLETPSGVGFSESGVKDKITDESTTQETLQALRQFFHRYPDMKDNKMYVIGHGYAAVYVTYLAKAIIDANKDSSVVYDDKINLEGIMVGNPCTKIDQCYASGSERFSLYHYEFLYKRAYFSDKAYGEFLAACLYNNSIDCFKARIKFDDIFNATNSSMYNIYDKCYRTKNISHLNYINTGCEDEAALITYLNDGIVKSNWNIREGKEWQPCNTAVFNAYYGQNNSYWLYPYLIQNNLRIWVYSGDLDSFVPITGTKRWIGELRQQLSIPQKRVWREWWVPGRHVKEDQVGGFIWELRDLNFVSVKGAGFRAGTDQPKAMEEILTGFLSGKTLPYKS